ncbi:MULTISPECIES: hypothetical protein [unclassified Thiocapsa]|uniref:hypothetical protein n=1 Tax=unclassified Thiocapsa TaxID=2641286 RepID=UPI0035B191A0
MVVVSWLAVEAALTQHKGYRLDDRCVHDRVAQIRYHKRLGSGERGAPVDLL